MSDLWPTLILSDLHLGHAATRLAGPEELEPLLWGRREVICNGDTWQERSMAWREEGARQLARLRELVAGEGAKLVLVPGNHDPDSGQEFFLRRGPGVLITHGHGVYREASPFSREYARCRGEIETLIAGDPEGDRSLEGRLERAQRIVRSIHHQPLPKLPVPLNFFATALWPPSRAFEILRVWGSLPRASGAFLREFSPADAVLVTGHFHRSGIWEQAGRWVINTGSFMRGDWPLLVEMRPGWLRVREVVQVGGRYHPGEVRQWWRLGNGEG